MMMRFRRLFQTISLILLHSSWGPDVKWLCNPVLSCHSCYLSWFACPIGVFIHYSGYHLFPYLAFGTVLLVGVLAGRLLCGWVCPFGFLQDMLFKLPTRKINIPRWSRFVKYPILVFTVFLIPFFLGEETLYSFCRICPVSAIQVTIPNYIFSSFHYLSTQSIIKLCVLCFVIVLAILSSRSFCKVFCPIGALLAPLNLISFHTVTVDRNACVSCRKCDRLCPTDVVPSERISNGIPANRAFDCVVCHDCKSLCSQADKNL